VLVVLSAASATADTSTKAVLTCVCVVCVCAVCVCVCVCVWNAIRCNSNLYFIHGQVERGQTNREIQLHFQFLVNVSYVISVSLGFHRNHS
jgi:hypothetical protein